MPTITDNTKSQITADVEENLFYIYYNWQARQNNRIHIGTCNNCRYGFGMKNDQVRGQNGTWIGPFATIELANLFLLNNGFHGMPPHDCIPT